jgi:hypothetical protein
MDNKQSKPLATEIIHELKTQKKMLAAVCCAELAVIVGLCALLSVVR